MDTKILVDKYIAEGEKLLRNLDAHHFPVNAALWFFDQNSDTWKYIISTNKFDKEGPLKAYQDIQKYIDSNNELSLNDITVVSPTNNLVMILKKAINTGPHAISGIRFSKNTINNSFIEDAYIYRMA